MDSSGKGSRKGLAKNSLLNLAGQILPMLAGVLTIPFIVRGLGTDGYGILSIAWLVLGYFGIFDLGLGRATIKFVAENLSPERIHRVPQLVWTSMVMLFALGCMGGAILAAGTPFAVTHLFRMPPTFHNEARAALFVLAAGMPVMLVNDAIRGVLEATQRFDLVNYVKVPSSVLFYLAAAAAIPFHVHVSGIIVLLVLIRAVSSGVYLTMCFHVIPCLKEEISVSREALRPLVRYGGWIMISNFMGPILGYLERFIIASVLSVGLLTYYSVPFDLVSKMLIFPTCVASALFPYFSSHGMSGKLEISSVTSRTLKYLLLVLTPVSAIFICFSHEILALWMGQQFAAQSAAVLECLTAALFLNALAFVPYSSVQALGRPDLKAVLDLIVLPVYGVACWLLTRSLGVTGAGLAKLLSGVIDTGALFVFAWRLGAFSPRDCVSGPLLRASVSGGTLVLAIWLIEFFHLDIAVSIVLVFGCLCIYSAAVWVVAVEFEEKKTLKTLPRLLLQATIGNSA